jgi:hypothetical protein
MTTIKPPGPGAPNDSLPAAESSSSSANPGMVEANPASSATGTAPTTDVIAALSARVEAGQLGMAQAVDTLIERQLLGAGKHLTADQAAELRALLHAAVASDPTLLALSELG